MKSLAAVCRGRGATLLLVFVSLSLCSCLKLESTTCPSGLTCPAGMTCAANQDICIDDSPSCGDGIVQLSVGEACDDGNILDGDGCSQDCKSDEACGNGRVDKDEVCDDGNKTDGDSCSADCRSDERCSNGVIDFAAGEVCDDGNKTDGDNCSATCHSDERCGNGIVDAAALEVCDDGNTANGDGCSSDCRSGEGCGNGTQDHGEQCDPGPNGPTRTCTTDCTVSQCGDGIINPAAGEECEAKGESSTCDRDCTLPTCGDGIVNVSAGEQCDPSAPNSTTRTCNKDKCTISRCGDEMVNVDAGEECDDGPRNGTGRCLSSCKLNYCGDGIVQEDREACDDGNTLACGRCNATCSQVQSASAQGSITAVSGADIRDQDSFSISDGVNFPIIFEFDKADDGVSEGHIEITVNRHLLAWQVAEEIAKAINDPRPPWLNIVATRKSSSATVDLKHQIPGPFGSQRIGSFGNQRIIENVERSGFTVTGMSGGQGGDCTVGVGCTEDNDCAPELECEEGICR